MNLVDLETNTWPYEPWKLVKTDMERVVLSSNICLQLVANLAIAFEPFLPFSSEHLRQMLNMDTFDWAELGRNDLLPAGHQLNKPELLFEKDQKMPRLKHSYKSCSIQRKQTKRLITKPNRSAPISNLTTS